MLRRNWILLAALFCFANPLAAQEAEITTGVTFTVQFGENVWNCDVEGGVQTGQVDFLCAFQWPTPPPAPTPLVRLTGITAPASIPNDQLGALTEGTICISYDATGPDEGGLFSRDHNGYGSGGHTTIWLRGSELVARSQNTNATFRIIAAGALGAHRICYRWGTEMMLWIDGMEAARNAHSGSMAGNEQPAIVGGNCAYCSPGTTDRIRSRLNGVISELEVYSSALPDSSLARWTGP